MWLKLIAEEASDTGQVVRNNNRCCCPQDGCILTTGSIFSWKKMFKEVEPGKPKNWTCTITGIVLVEPIVTYLMVN